MLDAKLRRSYYKEEETELKGFKWEAKYVKRF